MYELGLQDNPPPRVVLGSDAFSGVEGKYGPDGYLKGYKEYEKLSKSTDVDE